MDEMLNEVVSSEDLKVTIKMLFAMIFVLVTKPASIWHARLFLLTTRAVYDFNFSFKAIDKLIYLFCILTEHFPK